MVHTSRAVTLFPLIVLFLALMAAAAEPSLLVGEERDYEVISRVSIKNSTGKPLHPLDVSLPLLRSIPPYQEVRIDGVTPRPDSLTFDAPGNVIAAFKVKGIAPGEAFSVTVKARVASCRVLYQCDPFAVQPLPEGLASYRKATGDYPAGDALVAKTLAEVAKGETNPWFRALCLYDFIRGFTFELTLSPKPVLLALAAKKVQCSDAVSTLITLLRAAGIPARYVAGISLVEGKSEIVHTHAWAEMYVAGTGWVPLDPTLSRFNEGARLLRFAEKEPGQIIFSYGRHDPVTIRSTGPGKPPITRKDISWRFSYRVLSEKDTGRIGSFYGEKAFKPGGVGAVPPPPPMVPAGVSREYEEALALRKKGDLKPASALIESLIEKEPLCLPLHMERLEIGRLQGTLQNLEESYHALSKAHRAEPLYPYLEGRAALDEGAMGKAFAAFFEARRRGGSPGGDATALESTLGYSFLATKQYGPALESYARVLCVDGRNTAALANSINFFYLYRGWGPMATLAGYGVRAFEGSQTTLQFSGLYALALIEKKSFAEARAFLEETLKHAPRDGWLHALLGVAHLGEGRRAEGARELARGLELGTPDRPYFERKLAEARSK
ncbi:MAG: transglutaminase domain-containing protein [Candidatus Eremiobacteraeota bacterium]|nr:transglutaminase domain-containing protein [Candidatus Eremiobacteraeota bacterium]